MLQHAKLGEKLPAGCKLKPAIISPMNSGNTQNIQTYGTSCGFSGGDSCSLNIDCDFPLVVVPTNTTSSTAKANPRPCETVFVVPAVTIEETFLIMSSLKQTGHVIESDVH